MRVGWSALLISIGACGTGSEFPPVLGSTGDAGSRGIDASPVVPSFGPAVAPSDDPSTCEQAAEWQSYVGCDFWPTVVANNVWSIFDFAVVVANAGTAPAVVTLTGGPAGDAGAGVNQSVTVPPNGLAKLYAPWVPALKGPDADACGESSPLTASVVATGAAYHLVSSVPVTVYQFNALEYVGQGGPAGKDWSSCPGNQQCSDDGDPNYGSTIGCYSFTNDSSLLLPSTALTGNYRISGYPGETVAEPDGGTLPDMGAYVAITGITAGTHVTVYVGPSGDILADALGAVSKTPANGVLTLTLDAGDVAELVTDVGDNWDLSGSLITADQPIQVISGSPCEQIPETAPACDHLEQTVFPAETLGKQYFVNIPSGPSGGPVGHVVRFYGNVDGTTLAYVPAMPSGCPTTLDAGQVVTCTGTVESDFEVTGSNEFGVGTFMLGGSIVDPGRNGGLGDPSQSMVASVEQYRTKYVFLAPDDYPVSLIDVIAPVGADMVLDGKTVDFGVMTPIADGYEVWRIGLEGTSQGAHTLLASAPVGVQVMGYGEYTSYQYPAGLNLKRIAPPPGPAQ